MKRFRKRLQKKLKSQSGETLSEVLIAVLVSTLGITLLAGMITSSTDIITRSKANFNNYIEEENELVEQLSGKNGKVIIQGINLATDYYAGGQTQIPVNYFSNEVGTDEEGNAKVIYTYKVK